MFTAPEFPAGAYVAEPNPSAERLAAQIDEIEQLPAFLRQLVEGLRDNQLDTKYKNWTVRQIVHHLADSHVNGYVRTKLALTEDLPTVKPYDPTKWSELPDANQLDVDVSLRLLEAIHARWTATLRALSAVDVKRQYLHPELDSPAQVAELIGLYAWHGRHHAQAIALLAQQHGWVK